jgi:hypothetical protein
MNIKILGYDWKVKVLSKKDLKKAFGKCSAIMVPSDKTIYLRKDRVDYLHIAHEVSHAVIFYTCKAEVQYDDDSWEEYCCDLIGLHGQAIHELTLKILKDLL